VRVGWGLVEGGGGFEKGEVLPHEKGLQVGGVQVGG